MPDPCTVSYFSIQHERIEENIHRLTNRFPIDPVHDIRVGVKRMRALFRFIDQHSDGRFSQKEKIAPYRRLFKQLATLRDVQIQLQLFRSTGKRLQLDLSYLLSILKDLERQEKSALRRNELLDLYQMSELKRSIEPEIFRQSKGRLRQHLRHYITDRTQAIVQAIPGLKADQNIHKQRIDLKELYYLIELHVFCYSVNRRRYEMQLVEYKRASDLLGLWQDHAIALEYFKTFSKLADKRKLRNKKYARLHSELVSEKRALKKSIRSEFNTLQDNFREEIES